MTLEMKLFSRDQGQKKFNPSESLKLCNGFYYTHFLSETYPELKLDSIFTQDTRLMVEDGELLLSGGLTELFSARIGNQVKIQAASHIVFSLLGSSKTLTITEDDRSGSWPHPWEAKGTHQLKIRNCEPLPPKGLVPASR